MAGGACCRVSLKQLLAAEKTFWQDGQQKAQTVPAEKAAHFCTAACTISWSAASKASFSAASTLEGSSRPACQGGMVLGVMGGG